MPNLDIYLQDNGLLEYSRDLALTQYSTDYKIRLLTKKKYLGGVTMSATTGIGVSTYSKYLYLNPNERPEGRYSYEYKPPVEAINELTCYDFVGDKSTIKIAFHLRPYEDKDDTISTSIVYIPLIKSLENKPSELVTESQFSSLTQRLNGLYDKLEDLGYGEIDIAKDYNASTGTIQAKFEQIETNVRNLEILLETLDQRLGTYTDPTTGEITQTISSALAELELTRLELERNLEEVQNSLVEVDSRLDATEQFATDIAEIRASISAALKYKVVGSFAEADGLRESRVVYLVPEPGDAENDEYTEYMWVSNHWEKIGTTKSTIDLTQYLKKGELNAALLENPTIDSIRTTITKHATDLQSHSNRMDDIDSNISGIETTLRIKANSASTLAGYGITDAYTRGEVDSKVSTINSNITSARTDAQSALNNAISGVNSQYSELRNEHDRKINENKDLATRALETALAKKYSLSFETLDELKAWLQVQPVEIVGATQDSRYLKVPLGTDLYIKDPNIPDYWVSGYKYYDATNQWVPETIEVGTTQFPNSYYEIEEIEINLTNYYTKSEVNDKETALDTKIDQNVSNLTSEISRIENSTYTRDIIDNKDTAVKTEIYQTLEEDYATKEFVNSVEDSLIQSITDTAAGLSARIDTNESDIDNLESGLSAEITRSTNRDDSLESAIIAEAGTRTSEDNRVLQTAKNWADANDAALRSDLENAYLKPKTALAVEDYSNGSRIRFTTNQDNKDFEISQVDMTTIQNFLTLFGANEY